MAKSTLTMRIEVAGTREALAAFRGLPKEASNQLRTAAGKIATSLAASAKQASNIDAQAAAVGTTIKVARDRVPSVQVGGSKRVTSSRAPAYALLFGSEFGADSRYGWYAASKYGDSAGHQFSQHQGRNGRWFFPTLEREVPDAMREWKRAVDTLVSWWGSGHSGSGG